MDQGTISQAPPQQQELGASERHSRDVNLRLELKFRQSALKKTRKLMGSFSTTHNFDKIDELLWRKVLEAKLNVMKDYIFLKSPPLIQSQGAPFDLDADISSYSKSSTLTKALDFRER